jgi:putative transcriptional regulator
MPKIRVKLSRILGDRRITQAKLAELAKLSPRTINKIYNEDVTSIRFDTLANICKALKCRVEDILEYHP